MENYEFDIPKHRKKKDNGSKTNRRSSHKHQYQDIIMEGWLYGFCWAERCSICGRLKSKGFSTMTEGLMHKRDTRVISKDSYLTLEEIHEKFPNVDVYYRKRNEDGSISFNDEDLVKIDFSNT